MHVYLLEMYRHVEMCIGDIYIEMYIGKVICLKCIFEMLHLNVYWKFYVY